MSAGPQILVVEDEPAIADTVVYALSTDGFAPHWAGSGEAALVAAAATPFALAIVDIGLPDMNGFDLFRQLAAAHPGLVVRETPAEAVGRHFRRARGLRGHGRDSGSRSRTLAGRAR